MSSNTITTMALPTIASSFCRLLWPWDAAGKEFQGMFSSRPLRLGGIDGGGLAGVFSKCLAEETYIVPLVTIGAGNGVGAADDVGPRLCAMACTLSMGFLGPGSVATAIGFVGLRGAGRGAASRSPFALFPAKYGCEGAGDELVVRNAVGE